MARLATTSEKLVAKGPNRVALATPQVATLSPVGYQQHQNNVIIKIKATMLQRIANSLRQIILCYLKGTWNSKIIFGKIKYICLGFQKCVFYTYSSIRVHRNKFKNVIAGRCKRRKAGVLVWRRRMPWIERDGEWEKLLLEWCKPGSKLDWWWWWWWWCWWWW